MNLLDRFHRCSGFLRPWSELLEVEALKRYPNHRPGQLKEWITSLDKLNHEELLAFQNHYDVSSIDSQSLKALVKEIEKLTHFQKLEVTEKDLPASLLRKVTPKKEHEITCILNMTRNFQKVDAVLDIGGGVGHLSAALIYDKGVKAYCVDSNPKLQSAGKKRLAKWDQKMLNQLRFVGLPFDDQFELTEFDQHENRLVIGLHSCGKLGTDLVKAVAVKKYERFILASCCYHKLDGAYNISKASERVGICFSHNALHLAARCHRFEDPQDFQNKVMLRKYRYALHLLNYQKGISEFKSIGNTKLSDYQARFFEYALKYSSFDHLMEDEAQSFYEAQATQEAVREIILVDVLRALFGRVIESYLVLDRALFLQEQGHTVDLLEGFDRKLSPRNLVVRCS